MQGEEEEEREIRFAEGEKGWACVVHGRGIMQDCILAMWNGFCLAQIVENIDIRLGP